MSKNKDDNEIAELSEGGELIKRTLMVAAYPALINSSTKDGETLYNGFLPGFSSKVEDLESEDECVEYLQDILDDEVEGLVCMGKSLPYVEEDEELMEKYPNHKIVYLDINVYATKEELEYYDACAGGCEHCGHKCGEEDFFDECGCEDCYEDECDCEDCRDDEDDCDCQHHHRHHHDHNHDHSHHHNHGHHHCDCGDNDCDCENRVDNNHDSCGCGSHNHEYSEYCHHEGASKKHKESKNIKDKETGKKKNTTKK